MPAIRCPNCEQSRGTAGCGICYFCGDDLVVLDGPEERQDGLRYWLRQARLEPMDTACLAKRNELGRVPFHYDAIQDGDRIILRRANGEDEHVEGLIGSIHTGRRLKALGYLRGEWLSDRLYQLNQTKSAIVRQQNVFGTPTQQARKQHVSILKTLRAMAVKREDYSRALELHETMTEIRRSL